MNNNPLFETFNGSLRVAVIGVLAILALFLLAETIDAAGNFGRPSVAATDTITVNGDGQATLPPDVAHISFTVQNTAATVADAQAATTKQANAAIAYVKGQKVADKDVKTLSYDISPQYSYSTGVCPPVAPTPGGITSTVVCPGYGSQKITGYQVSETVQVTMRDLTAVGAMLSGLGQLNVQNLLQRLLGRRRVPGYVQGYGCISWHICSDPAKHPSWREYLQRLRLNHLRDSLVN
jgi:uncharacterized protein YggE